VAEAPILRVTGLHKSFGAVVAARNISVDVASGEVVGIIGANGAGKTVFVNMITGYLKPSRGTIVFAGTDITGIRPCDAAHIGVCRSFQTSQVFMTMSVLENLLIATAIASKDRTSLLRPLRDHVRITQCEAILDRYGIREYRDRVASTLSQGARKLLDIAMAGVCEPRVLLLDEPTSGVSVEEKYDIMDVVISASRSQDTAVLLVEHDMEIVERYADRVLAFDQGEKICDAPPRQVLADPRVRELIVGPDDSDDPTARPRETADA